MSWEASAFPKHSQGPRLHLPHQGPRVYPPQLPAWTVQGPVPPCGPLSPCHSPADPSHPCISPQPAPRWQQRWGCGRCFARCICCSLQKPSHRCQGKPDARLPPLSPFPPGAVTLTEVSSARCSPVLAFASQTSCASRICPSLCKGGDS